MKKATILFLFICTGILAQTAAKSQSSDVYFIIHKVNGKILTKATNQEKTMVFEIAGFTEQPQVDAFIKKLKTFRGIISITVADTHIDNKWKATAVFYRFANKEYFKYLFAWCGVKHFVIENKNYNAQNFSEISND